MQLDIELGKHVGVEDACFRYVPDSSGFYNVPNDNLLDGLILGHAPGAVRAANGLHMAAALFGATVVSSFFGHLGAKTRKRIRRLARPAYIVRDSYAHAEKKNPQRPVILFTP